MNKPTREEVLTLADTVALCGAPRLAEVLRRSVKLEAENERMRKALQMVAALPGFEPEEPYGQAVLGALMSRINYTPDNEEDK